MSEATLRASRVKAISGRPDAQQRQSIVSSSFNLDLCAGQLTRAGRPIPLRPKTWAVLLRLVEQPGALVTTEQLLDAVWPDVAVTPDTLTKSIGELRAALADHPREPRFIETVHRRGFRFIGRVGEEAASGTAAAGSLSSLSAERWFVGRTAELHALMELWRKASTGQRQILFVTGSAGIGKTALVDAFLDSHALLDGSAPLWIGRGDCIEQHGTQEPYLPVLEALDRLSRRQDADRLIALLRRVAPTWLAQLPWLIGDGADELRHRLEAARPERMLREFAVLIEAFTTDLTLVLVLEDLHWSDRSTVDLLTRIAQRPEPARLLVIGTYRPADLADGSTWLSPAIDHLRRHRHCVDLALHELQETEVRTYLETRFPGAAPPPNLAGVIHGLTNGTPLFITAVVDSLVSRGWILNTAPGWSFVIPSREMKDLGVPDDVRRMIAAEFDTLSPMDRRVLDAASVAGHSFVAAVIAAALQSTSDDVESRCEAFAHAGRFLQVTGATEWPDGSVVRCYAFTHELYRRVAYDAIPERSRQELHRKVGEVLEAAYGEHAEDLAPELAIHFGHGRDPARAIHYLVAAANRARQRFAGREAIAYLESAVGVLATLPDSAQRGRQELALRLELAPLLSDLCGFASDELLRNCTRAYELCAQVGDPAQRFQIVYALCHVHFLRADTARAPVMAAELDELARRLGTAESHFLAQSGLARMAALEGRFAAACRMAEDVLSARRDLTVSPWLTAFGPDPIIATECDYTYALWFLGDLDRARTTMCTSLAAASQGGSPFTHAHALGLMTVLEILCRNPAEVRRLADRLFAHTAEYGFPFWNAIASALRGWARVQEGDLPAAVEELKNAQVAYAATGGRIFSTHILAFLAEAFLRSGQLADGLAAVSEALQVAEETLDRSWRPELWRLKGELLLADAARAGRRGGKVPDTVAATLREEGEACCRQALEAARDVEAKSLELRAATSLARVWSACGRRADACQLLDGVCSAFGPNRASPDLLDAREMLEVLSQHEPTPHHIETSTRPRVAPGRPRRPRP